MKRLTALLVALCAAAFATVARAQTQSADATASITAAASLTVVKVQDMDFGTVFRSVGVVSSGNGVEADWQGSTDPNGNLSFSFTLPTVLNGPGGATVPFSCGTQAALVGSDNPSATFDPNTGLAGYAVGVGGGFSVRLGAFTGASSCQVNLTGAAIGTFSGIVTLTVAAL